MPESYRKVRVLINPKSGLWWSKEGVRRAIDDCWDVGGIDLTYQMSKNPVDGQKKAKLAVQDGVDTIIVVGGDGMVNTIGSVLVNTSTALAVIPAGSGNGFARHFDISLNPEKAAESLAKGKRQKIDVGFVNGNPFFITCGLAWDADIVEGFEKSPVRGILPYMLAGIYSYFTYEPQDFVIEIDEVKIVVAKPLVLTIANMTTYGGGAMIAPDACPDDGKMELISVEKGEPVQLLTQIHRLFDGSIKEASIVETRKFKRLRIIRERPDPIQVDGELLQVEKDFHIEVKPLSLQVIVPQ